MVFLGFFLKIFHVFVTGELVIFFFDCFVFVFFVIFWFIFFFFSGF